MKLVELDSLSSSEGENKKHKLKLRKPVALNQYRRREKIRGRYGIMLFVYACMLIMLGYFLIEIMKMVR